MPAGSWLLSRAAASVACSAKVRTTVRQAHPFVTRNTHPSPIYANAQPINAIHSIHAISNPSHHADYCQLPLTRAVLSLPLLLSSLFPTLSKHTLRSFPGTLLRTCMQAPQALKQHQVHLHLGPISFFRQIMHAVGHTVFLLFRINM
jgi:hypothetical protein